MRLVQSQHTEQKLILTQGMRQSLDMLQMPLIDLKGYLDEQALSNPLIELEPARLSDEQDTPFVQTMYRADCIFRSGPAVREPRDENRWDDLSAPPDTGIDLIEYLNDQLLGMKHLDPQMTALCKYLILCLNERGYFEHALDEIAEELHISLFDAEQALFILQSLQPAGVAARSLQECLILQLMQGSDFNALTLHAAQDGLELIAKNDMAGLARQLNCSRAQAERTAEIIRDLNPIPAQGFGREQMVGYQIPEASVRVENGQPVLELNRSFLPRIIRNREITDLLMASTDLADREYLQKNMSSANQLIKCVENRQSTMERLLLSILRHQRGYFLGSAPLQPMTMGELAKELGLNISTVSRAINGKTVFFHGKILALRDLFTSKIITDSGSEVSSSTIKQQLAFLIKKEDPAKPFSDEDLRSTLLSFQIRISRRTVAKYREELGIPSSSRRRRI